MGVLSELSFAWFYVTPESSVSAKHSKAGACSCSLGLPPSISHRRLSNALFVPLFFNLLPLSFSCANLDLAFRRVANLQVFNFDSSFNEFNLQTL